MKNLKLELFNFKNSLNVDQLDVAKIIHLHLENYDNLSEKEMLTSLGSHLNGFTYYKEVKQLLEGIKDEIESKPLVYELKDLYKKVERQNTGMLYRQPLNVILEIINKPDDDARMESILNELSIYDWVNPIKHFMMQITASPIERQNLVNSGKGNKIYTVVEKTDSGHMAYISDRWFLIEQNEIKQVLADDYVKDEEKLRNIRLIEKVMAISEIKNDTVYFQIDENLQIGISLKNKDILLNGQKLDKETTLESIFNSPIVPYLKREYYVLVEATINNADKFMDLDIGMKVTNILNPFSESYVFNYKDKNYVYSRDSRYGTKFFAYENVTELIHDVQKEFDFDLTNFYENKVSNEMKRLRTLEDREKEINMKLQDVNESIEELSENQELLKESKELSLTFNNLLVFKHKLINQLNGIKLEKSETRKQILK